MASRWPALLALLLAAACSRTTLRGSIADEHGAQDETTEMDFWDALAARRAISNHDALHALLVSFTRADADAYATRLASARKRGWVADDDPLPANETARVGWIARAVCLEADIRGGLTMRLVGARERYAVKELNWLGWLPEMSERQALSGLQLIALLSSAEDHIAARTARPGEDT